MPPEHCLQHEDCTKSISELEKRVAVLETNSESHRADYLAVVKGIQACLAELKNALCGTPDGRKGLNSRVDDIEVFIAPMKQANRDIINWVYKGAMIVGMVWIMSHLR